MGRSNSEPLRSVGAFTAKTHLSRYLADAERGIVTLVTVRGRPVAKIVPAAAEVGVVATGVERTLARARLLRARNRRGPETLHALVSKDRR